MAFDKPFLDLEKQLNLLESRNLIIANRDRAKRLIMTSSYYDLINGYKSVFMLSNDRFKDNVKLEDIYIFSFIDKGIQSITMKYSLMIETLFKTRLSYVISNILYTIVPNGVLKREKGEITSRDKKSLKGIYGVLIMTALLLNDKLLVSSLIAECRGVFKPEVSGDDDSKHIVDLINELKQKYKEATQIPIDFIDRLEIIYKSIT